MGLIMQHEVDTYLIEYRMDGGTYLLAVKAESPDDAKRRVAQAAAFGTVINPTGEAWRTGPHTGWILRLWAWWRNRRVKQHG